MEALESWRNALSSSQRRRAYAEYVQAWEAKLGAFLAFDPERRAKDAAAARDRQTEGPLAGLPFAVKDNIAVEGFPLTCASRMLEGLTSPYTATAVKRLEAAGGTVVGKTNLDEFGMGSATDNSALQTTSNPWDVSRVPGGSSGGSAAAVAAGLVPFALGSDTGGSVRQPAAFCGVYGLKPTYGAVSRYGLVAYASSLEGIGVLAESVALARLVFETMKGIDPFDHTSVEHRPSSADGARNPGATGPQGAGLRVGVLRGLSELSPEVEAVYRGAIARLDGMGMTVAEIELPTLEYVVPAYYTIATAEASANLARFNGIRYGHRPEYAENPEQLVQYARDEGFGAEVKLRILLGTYVLRSGFQDQYYVRAQRVRTAIRNDLAAAFGRVDLLLLPVYPTAAFKRGEEGLTPFQQKLADKFTATANLAGIPGLAFPAGVVDGMPVGLQFLAPAFEEERLFRAAERYGELSPIQHPPGYSSEWRG